MKPNPSLKAERQRQATRARAGGTRYIFTSPGPGVLPLVARLARTLGLSNQNAIATSAMSDTNRRDVLGVG